MKGINRIIALLAALAMAVIMFTGCYLNRQSSKDSSLYGLSVGNSIYYGNYPQADSSKSEPIMWQVLAVEDGKALVISVNLLDCRRFSSDSDSLYWNYSDMRQWLNEDFINTAFDESEQAHITPVSNDNLFYPGYSYLTGTANTTDSVFLLSYDQVRKLFSSDKRRIAKLTAFAVENGDIAELLNSGDYSWRWWLRTEGCEHGRIMYIDEDGHINKDGTDAYSDKISVRPAMWLDPEGRDNEPVQTP